MNIEIQRNTEKVVEKNGFYIVTENFLAIYDDPNCSDYCFIFFKYEFITKDSKAVMILKTTSMDEYHAMLDGNPYEDMFKEFKVLEKVQYIVDTILLNNPDKKLPNDINHHVYDRFKKEYDEITLVNLYKLIEQEDAICHDGMTELDTRFYLSVLFNEKSYVSKYKLNSAEFDFFV